jgi:hypothetical protein
MALLFALLGFFMACLGALVSTTHLTGGLSLIIAGALFGVLGALIAIKDRSNP